MTDRLRDLLERTLPVVEWARRRAMSTDVVGQPVELLQEIKAALAEPDVCEWKWNPTWSRYECNCDRLLRHRPTSETSDGAMTVDDGICPGCGHKIEVRG